MAQIKKKFIGADQVDGSKILLSNDEMLRARNAADSADIDILKVNASDRIEFDSVPQVTSDAVSANDLVRYSQLTAALDSIKPKTAVAVASTGDIDLSVAADPSPVDGYTLQDGDRILLWQQTASEENGIYDAVDAADPTSWVRSSDFNAPSEIPGAYTVAQNGTLYQGVLFVTTSSPAVIGVDPILFVDRAIATYSGGDMITLTGTVFSVDLAAVSGLESSNPGNAAGQLRVKLEASNPSLKIDGSNQLAAKLDGARAITSGASGLGVAVAAAGGIEISANALQIKSDTATASTIGVTSTSNGAGTKFDSNSFADSGSETLALAAGVAGAGLALTTGVLSVNVDDSTIEIATDTLQVKDLGITAAKMSSGAATSGQVATADGAGGVSYEDPASAPTMTQDNLTLSGGDITAQFKDLLHPAMGSSASVNSISLSVVGGPQQLKTVDYTVSLTGGAGGVTRITFAGDLATGGPAELIAGDILMVQYEY